MTRILTTKMVRRQSRANHDNKKNKMNSKYLWPMNSIRIGWWWGKQTRQPCTLFVFSLLNQDFVCSWCWCVCGFVKRKQLKGVLVINILTSVVSDRGATMRNQNKKYLILTIVVVPIFRVILEVLAKLKQMQSVIIINETLLTESFVKPTQKSTSIITLEMIEQEQSRRIDHIRLKYQTSFQSD